MKINQFTTQEVDKVFDALITSRVRYGLSVYGSDHAVLKKVERFLHRCREKGFTTDHRTTEDLLKEEDDKLKHKILTNHLHPLLPFLTSCPTQSHNNTRQKYSQLKPVTRTKTASSIFCNRIRPF